MTERTGKAPHITSGRKVSPREREVLVLTATGLQSREIANQLYIHPQTVKNHRYNAYIKLDVHNAAQAVSFLMATDEGFYDEVKESVT